MGGVHEPKWICKTNIRDGTSTFRRSLTLNCNQATFLLQTTKMRLSSTVPLLAAFTLVGAWDFSFLNRAVYAVQKTFGLRPPTVRIAIVGAGAGGSSAGEDVLPYSSEKRTCVDRMWYDMIAYWIAKAQERHGLDVEVDVFEKASIHR